MSNTFSKVIENFEFQARYAEKMGSPFYAKILGELGELISRDSSIGDIFSNWQGAPQADAVALRFVAAFHYLVITNQDSSLVSVFPPSEGFKSSEQDEKRRYIFQNAIESHQELIIKYLKSPPQTNEVGRSIVLVGGFLEIVKRFGKHIDIFEIGASAGLNLYFDQYHYQCESWQWGNTESKVRFSPNWQGTSPPPGSIKVHNRRACDVSPVSINTQKDRLLSYVWPDQIERIERLRAAIEYVGLQQPSIDKSEATEWLQQQAETAATERPRVFYHSIIWQYFSHEQKQAFENAMQIIGNSASEESPVIWMRLEPSKGSNHAELRCTVWPNKEKWVLAQSGFHGEWVRWFGNDFT